MVCMDPLHWRWYLDVEELNSCICRESSNVYVWLKWNRQRADFGIAYVSLHRRSDHLF